MKYARREVLPIIQSCAGTIARAAYRAHRRLQPDDRVWIETEDLIQEGRLAAWQIAIGRKATINANGSVHISKTPAYDKDKGTKFNTFLTRGLLYHMTNNVVIPLIQQKRKIPGLLERFSDDAGTYDSVRVISTWTINDLADPMPAYSAYEAAVSFINLCRALDGPAVVWLVRNLLLRKTGSWKHDLLPAIQGAARQTNVRFEDLIFLTKSEDAVKISLHMLTQDRTINMGVENDGRILECSECSGTFPLVAIRDGRFNVLGMACRTCYRKLKKDSCFGKLKTEDQEGFSANDIECRLHCIDRIACKQFSQGENMGKVAEENELDDMEFDESEETETDEETEPEAKPAKKAKAGKPATKKTTGKAPKTPAADPVKAGKAAKGVKPATDKPEKEKKGPPKPSDEDLPNAEEQKIVGTNFPFRPNSMLRYAFKLGLTGIKREQLEKRIAKAREVEPGSEVANATVRHIMKGLNQGYVGKGTAAEPSSSHTWKVNQEGGMIKIFSVKQRKAV